MRLRCGGLRRTDPTRPSLYLGFRLLLILCVVTLSPVGLPLGGELVLGSRRGVLKLPDGEEVYIEKKDIERYGFTRGRSRCDRDHDYGFGRTSRPHSRHPSL